MIYYVTSFLWIAYLLLLIPIFIFDKSNNTKTIVSAKELLVLFIILLAAHSTLFSPYWFGIEYEDAFEYIYSANYIAADTSGIDYNLNPICIYGNISNCQSHASLAHPTGLSTLLSLIIRFLGESSYYGLYFSIFCTAISSLIIFRVLLLLGVSSKSSIIAAAAYLSSIGVIVFGSTGLAEPVSSFLVLSSFWGAILSLKRNDNSSYPSLREWMIIAFTSISITLAVSVKRESAVLLPSIAIGIIALVVFSDRSSLKLANFRNAIVSILLAAGLVLFVYGESLLDMNAVNPTKSAAFGTEYITKWGSYYIKVFLSESFFLITVPALIGVLFIDKQPLALIVLVISVSYILLFVSFSQSYYAVMFGEIPTFHFKRYTIQIMPLLAVLAGVGIHNVELILKNIPRLAVFGKPLYAIGGSILLLSMFLGVIERRSYAEEEESVRISPIAAACVELKDYDTVITDEIILFELFCEKPLTFISINSLGSTLAPEILNEQIRENTYLWINIENLINEHARFPSAFNVLINYSPELFLREYITNQRQLIKI